MLIHTELLEWAYPKLVQFFPLALTKLVFILTKSCTNLFSVLLKLNPKYFGRFPYSIIFFQGLQFHSRTQSKPKPPDRSRSAQQLILLGSSGLFGDQ